MKSARPIMDMVVSAGIIAFGVWVVVGTITAGWPLASIMGLFAILVGTLSLVGSVRDARYGRKPVRSDLQSARLVDLGLKAKGK